jgi:hypothetical protein
MENPSDRALTVTLSWTSGSKKHSAAVPLGALARVAAMLALCALSYEFGSLRARLEQSVIAVPAAMAPVKLASSKPVDQTVADNKPVITPLNVMDPSALVMGPSGTWDRTPPAPPPSVPGVLTRQAPTAPEKKD